VTTRGQKHLRELMALEPPARAVMLYFINRGDCDRFCPGDEADPEYGQLLRQAIAAGVTVLPCRFDVQPTEVRYLGLSGVGAIDLHHPYLLVTWPARSRGQVPLRQQAVSPMSV
jgi:DNA-binding sugar fermentation-stimulating protein